ncbi:MAG: hypothetical protein AVDCRST_MAG89-2881, partial [uncultured Gemmatimonadetes bacterium]
DPTTLRRRPRAGRTPHLHAGPRVGRSGAQGGGAHRLGPHDAARARAGGGAADGRARRRGDPRADADGRPPSGRAPARPVRQHQRVGGHHPQPQPRRQPLRALGLALRQLLLGAAHPGRARHRPPRRAARRRAPQPAPGVPHLPVERVAAGGGAGHRPGVDAAPGGRRAPAAAQQRAHHPAGHRGRPRRKLVHAGGALPVQQPARLLGLADRLLGSVGRVGPHGGGLRGERGRPRRRALPAVAPAAPGEAGAVRGVVARGDAGRPARVSRVAGARRAGSAALPLRRVERRRAAGGAGRLPPGELPERRTGRL